MQETVDWLTALKQPTCQAHGHMLPHVLLLAAQTKRQTDTGITMKHMTRHAVM